MIFIYEAFPIASFILGSNRSATDVFFWVFERALTGASSSADNFLVMLRPSMGSSTMSNTVDLDEDGEDASLLS